MKILSLIYLALLILLSIFPQIITPHTAVTTDANQILSQPQIGHPFGTDELGRDMLARLLEGAKYSLSITLIATLLSGLMGLLMGSLSATMGGFVDFALLRLTDLFYGIPDLLIYILLGLFLGQSPLDLALSLALFGWLSLARLARFEILKEKNKDYVTAARALGQSRLSIVIKHLIPNIWPLYKTALILKIPHFILAEATLSFLGLGLQAPLSSFGLLAAQGYQALRFYPHLAIVPMAAIGLLMLAIQTLARKRPD